MVDPPPEKEKVTLRMTWEYLSHGIFGQVTLNIGKVAVFLIVLGLLVRWAWTPLMMVLGSYLVIDLLIAVVFQPKEGRMRLFFSQEIMPHQTVALMVIAILITAGVTELLIFAAQGLDILLPSWLIVVVWSVIVANLLTLDLFLVYELPLDPRTKPRQSQPQSAP